MNNNPWYKEFFQKFYLDVYKDIFPLLQTEKEVDFVIDVLQLPKGSKILDLCGGYGRISIPLAKKGYNVYVQDLNKDFLEKAEIEAKKQKVKIETIHSDMRAIPFEKEFDAVIVMFNSFGYLESNTENEKVLKSINKALKQKGKFLIDVMNGNWLKDHYLPRTWRKVDNLYILEENHLDKKENKHIVKMTILDLKNSKQLSADQEYRLYNFNELKTLLISNGFKILNKFGDFDKNSFSSKLSKKITILSEKK